MEMFIHSDDPLSWVGPFNPKAYGNLYEYLLFYTRMSVDQAKINRIGVDLSEDAQGGHVTERHPVEPNPRFEDRKSVETWVSR